MPETTDEQVALLRRIGQRMREKPAAGGDEALPRFLDEQRAEALHVITVDGLDREVMNAVEKGAA